MEHTATLHDWTIYRSGGTITISHNTGKVTNIVTVEAVGNTLVATGQRGQTYVLAWPKK